jgi:ferrochelatase
MKSRFSAKTSTSSNDKENSNQPLQVGVLLTNLGSPSEPTEKAVRIYLREFLSDPRVVEIPRFIWMLILHGIVLRFRPKKSAKLYESVWTEQGAPLVVISQAQQQ